MAIAINADQIMSFGGSTEPCAVCTFGNIGSIDNAKFSKQVMDKIGKDLGVPAGRCESYTSLILQRFVVFCIPPMFPPLNSL